MRFGSRSRDNPGLGYVRAMAIGQNTPRHMRERLANELSAWGRGQDAPVRRFGAVADAAGLKVGALEPLQTFNELDGPGKLRRMELADKMVSKVLNSSLLELNAYMSQAGIN